MKKHSTFQCRAKLTKKGYRRLDWIRSRLNRLYNSALEERKEAWEKEKKSVSLYDQMKGLTRKGDRRLDWIRSRLNRLYNSALEERKEAWQPVVKVLTAFDRPYIVRGRRCDRLTDSRYARLSRLVRRAQERSRCSRDFHHGL